MKSQKQMPVRSTHWTMSQENSYSSSAERLEVIGSKQRIGESRMMMMRDEADRVLIDRQFQTFGAHDHKRTSQGGWGAAAPLTRAKSLFFRQKLNISGRNQQPKMY